MSLKYLFPVPLSRTFFAQSTGDSTRQGVAQGNDSDAALGPLSAIVDHQFGARGFLFKAHLRGDGPGRLPATRPITPHDPAATGTAPGINHQHLVHFTAPPGLKQQGDLNQDQLGVLVADLGPECLAGQRVKEAVDLPADVRILENAPSQGDSVDPAVGQKICRTESRAQRLPARLAGFKEMPAALIDINERRQAITGQQAPHRTFARADAAGNAENPGLHEPIPRSAVSTCCMSSAKGAVHRRVSPFTGCRNRRVLACSIWRSGLMIARRSTLPP